MNEDIFTTDLVKMETDIKEEVEETAHLPVLSESLPPPDDKALVTPCKEGISHDEMAAMRELAMAASEHLQKAPYTPTKKFHRKTGKIRVPKENSDSESSLSDDDDGKVEESDPAVHNIPTPVSSQKGASFNTAGSPSTSITRPSSNNPCWIRTSKGKYAINPIKCPPCARRKKADKCRGGPPCGECWSRGRKTAASCQEWGEKWEGRG